jgi:geranylgeranyl diphosphate synthase type II
MTSSLQSKRKQNPEFRIPTSKVIVLQYNFDITVLQIELWEMFMAPAEKVDSDFEILLRRKAQFINEILKQLLNYQQIDNDLKEVIRYSLFAPGKRIRSVLVLWCCELVSGSLNRDAEIAAAAIEMLHTYSLVHDDLPAMDNDDMRRGQPTCHKAFNEAAAILAGDALLTLAFELLAKEIHEPTTAVRLITQLAESAGSNGMIAGQMADLKAEKTAGSIEIIEYIHLNKTAKMFRCAAIMGAICGGADNKQLHRLGEYGLKLGLSFQIADDVLDVNTSSEQLGKTAGKDARAGKVTYPALLGIEQSKQVAEKFAREAVAALEPFGKKADALRHLAMQLLHRKK